MKEYNLQADESVSEHINHKSNGMIHIVGFGPGNPELLTIKAQRLLEATDVIFYDDLLDHNYLDQFKAEKVYVGKRKGKHSARQEHINTLLLQAALEGKDVVRLKGGDPLIFGRGAEEYRYLKQHFVNAEIVPGVTSALAAAADAVIPLTCRGLSTSVAFALGHDAENNKLPQADTLVFYMGASQQQKWAQRLINDGWPANTPVASVRNASLPDQETRRYTLGQLKKEQEFLPAPCLVIVGHTASDDLESLGEKWLYTGSDVNNYKGQGIVIHNPMLEVKSLELSTEEKAPLYDLQSFDRIVFGSPFAVKEFFKVLFREGMDVRSLGEIKISSMGRATSEELRNYGLIVYPESEDYSTQGLVASFKDKSVRREHILIPCSTQGYTEFPEQLRLLGNNVKEWSLYTNILPERAVRHNLDEFKGVVFTSPITVKHFFRFYGHFPSHLVPIFKSDYTKQLFESMQKYGVEY